MINLESLIKPFLLLGVFLFSPVLAEQSRVHIIVNSSVNTNEISLVKARSIFSMRQTSWSDEQPITVFVLRKGHETHQKFSTKVLGLFPYQLERIWNKLVYSGLGEEPIKVKSEQDMLARVSNHPGSIGYVQLNPEHHSVKIINVIKESDQ